MKVVVTKTSEYHYMAVKEFNTIEELFGFTNKCGHPLVLKKSYCKGYGVDLITKYSDITEEDAKIASECDYSVEIYDDWRE